MEHLKNKSKESLKAAELLISQKLYNSSIHHFYYACFQLMLYVKETNPEVKQYYNRYYSIGKAQGSHESLISTVFRNLSTEEPIDAQAFKEAIDGLQELRLKADYYNAIISSREAELARRLADSVLYVLRKKYFEEDE